MLRFCRLQESKYRDQRHPARQWLAAATQAKIVVSEARIKFYRGKKMLSELTAAIDGLITEQTMFVAWWDANVGVRSGNPGNAALRSLLSVTAAETMTGITQQTVSRWRKSLQKPDKYRRLLLRDLALIAEANHRAEGTGETQWFTPAQYVEAARAVLGAIDLDPASHPTAQEWIGATQYFTETDDGLKQQWHGRVWCNPPYARDLIDRFAEKMIVELEHGHVSAAVMLTHSYTDTAWFHALAAVADAICFARGRIRRAVQPDTRPSLLLLWRRDRPLC